MKQGNGGPGKAYRQGISLIEAVQKFGDEKQAEDWFTALRWPNGIACPYCGSIKVKERASRKPMPFHCSDCRKYFSVKVGTLLQSSKLPLSKWAIAFYLYATNLKGVSSMKLHRDLGITQKSAWHMAHRIRESWNELSDRFAGPVEVDETYIGGKRKNMSNSKREELADTGRGTAGKVAVVGMKDRETGRIMSEVVESTDGPTLKGFVEDRTESDTVVYTDEAAAYRGMPRRHEAVKHSVSEYVRGNGPHERNGKPLGGPQARIRWGVPPYE